MIFSIKTNENFVLRSSAPETLEEILIGSKGIRLQKILFTFNLRLWNVMLKLKTNSYKISLLLGKLQNKARNADDCEPNKVVTFKSPTGTGAVGY